MIMHFITIKNLAGFCFNLSIIKLQKNGHSISKRKFKQNLFFYFYIVMHKFLFVYVPKFAKCASIFTQQ